MACFGEKSNKSHFIMVPLPAQGHMIPMIDLGCLLAQRGVYVSLVITHANANRIRPTIERAMASNLSIQFVEFSFPDSKFGLPPGSESIDNVSTDPSLYRPFFDALYSLSEPLETFLESLERPPDCMVTDMCNAWTAPVARKFGIPRVIFHGPCCFYISVDYNLVHHKVYDSVIDENEHVIVPDFPIELEVTKAQTPGFLNSPRFEDLRKMCLEEERTADGVVINTFVELEGLFVENYKMVTGKQVWTVGPLCLYNKDVEMTVCRGNKEAIDQRNRVLAWLDGREPASVLYISFGSVASTCPNQLMEIGSSLEASKIPFIWVLKKIELKPDFENWLSEGGFEERTKDRGLIIVGWAPQMIILSHPAVGGFVTHCGWNSLLEAISMGVPMITWPRFADQFVNENLIVNVLKIGVSLGAKVPNLTNEDVVMKADNLRNAVNALMDGGIEANERRERSKSLSEKAKKAVEEGGSSYVNMTNFIHYFTQSISKLENGSVICL